MPDSLPFFKREEYDIPSYFMGLSDISLQLPKNSNPYAKLSGVNTMPEGEVHMTEDELYTLYLILDQHFNDTE